MVDAAVTPPATTRVAFNGTSAGTYYRFGNTMHGPDFVVWDVRVDLAPGNNAVTLNLENMALTSGTRIAGTPPAGATAARAPAAAAPPPTAAVAPGAQARPAPAVDPSIAKARAAKVDTRVFGIPLGEPLRLPDCDSGQDGSILGGLFAPSANCISRLANVAAGFLAAFTPFKVDGVENVKTIMLAHDSYPSWVTGCMVYGLEHEGLLVAVDIPTGGRDVDAAVAKELRGKYGAPTLVKTGVVTPNVGNPFTVADLEWTLPGLHVQYDVVAHTEGTTSIQTNKGSLRIETEQAFQRRRATEQEQERTKPRL